MLRSLYFGAAVLVIGALLAGPASAKPKPVPTELVAVSGAGQGIAPAAPDAVREHVEKVLSGRGVGLEPGVDFLAASGSVRSPQGARRAQWIGCQTAYAWRGYNHWLGYNLVRYYQQVSWCSNGFSIYSWSRDRWPEINFPGWAFDGHIGSSLGGSTTQKQAWTQGAFHYCVGYCTYLYPWVSQTVTVDGAHYYSTGG